MQRLLALLLAVLVAGTVLAGPAGGAVAATAPDDPPEQVEPAPASPKVVVLGDSLTARARGKLRRLHPAWHVDGVRGRGVRRLPGLVADHLEQHRAPRVLVVALGSNPNASWTRDGYARVAAMLPPASTVVLVTPYRDPAVFAEDSRTLQRYTRWMRQVAAERPRSCVVPWRGRVVRRPHLLVDGVHATEQGERVWARLVSAGVRGCLQADSQAS